MPDYSKGKIYSIRNYKDDSIIYIGSTTQKLSRRMGSHRRDYIAKPKYRQARPIFDLGFETTYIELIKHFPCCSKTELLREEGKYIRSLKCCNVQVAGRTNKEYDEDNREKLKEYRLKNKQKKKEYDKKYNLENKEKRQKQRQVYALKNNEKIKQDKRQKKQCPNCDKCISSRNLSRHRNSDYCKNFSVAI